MAAAWRQKSATRGAPAFNFLSLTRLTAAATSGRVAARQQSCETFLVADAPHGGNVEVLVAHAPQAAGFSRRSRSSLKALCSSTTSKFSSLTPLRRPQAAAWRKATLVKTFLSLLLSNQKPKKGLADNKQTTNKHIKGPRAGTSLAFGEIQDFPGYMGQVPSRGHEASPQSGLGVGCKLCSSSKKMRGLSACAQARCISIPPLFSVLGISSFMSPPRSAMRRGAWKCNTGSR